MLRRFGNADRRLWPGPTNGTVTVAEPLPGGLSISAMSGDGWSCSGNSCARSDGPNANVPAIAGDGLPASPTYNSSSMKLSASPRPPTT